MRRSLFAILFVLPACGSSGGSRDIDATIGNGDGPSGPQIDADPLAPDARMRPDARMMTPDAPGGIGEPPELTGITLFHNQVRAGIVTTPGLVPLVWNQSLADTAAAWAAQCHDVDAPIGLIDHNPNRSDGHPYYVGENIYGASGSADAQGAVQLWAAEAANYDYATNTCSGVCGHYTQIVWRDTLELGCAKHDCPGLQYGSSIVCDYGPGGNIGGQRPY